jgi:hypothetical protein
LNKLDGYDTHWIQKNMKHTHKKRELSTTITTTTTTTTQRKKRKQKTLAEKFDW